MSASAGTRQGPSKGEKVARAGVLSPTSAASSSPRPWLRLTIVNVAAPASASLDGDGAGRPPGAEQDDVLAGQRR